MPAQRGQGARPKGLPKTVQPEHARALLGRPNLECPTGLRNRCMLELLYRAGLRNSECCGLHLRDVDWQAAEIRIRPEVAKGGREAVVYLEASTLALLERWKPVRRRYAKGAPELFVTTRGGPVSRHYVWEMTVRYARRAGVPYPVWPHMLRHSFATELLREGFNLREVQDRMRHADIRTTTVYTHLANAELAAKIRARSSETRG